MRKCPMQKTIGRGYEKSEKNLPRACYGISGGMLVPFELPLLLLTSRAAERCLVGPARDHDMAHRSVVPSRRKEMIPPSHPHVS